MLAKLAEPPALNSLAPLLDYYRCAELPAFGLSKKLGQSEGFFRFGPDVVCYGQTTGATRAAVNGHLFDALQDVAIKDGGLLLPFDSKQVTDNLRYEYYVQSDQRWIERPWVKDIYYRLRPMLPVSVRKHLQKAYLSGWDQIAFPAWPVDRSVDLLFEKLLALSMQALGIHRLPFIWFWPDGHSACAIMTHDVETAAGRDFSDRVMDIDDEFGIKASFQIVPEKRYTVPASYLQAIRDRGYEVNVQGLDHDGNLFQNRKAFLESARKINQYAVQYGAEGFRSPILYRNVEWFKELRFSYDMSIPNVAHLEAQRGGCCTVMPYTLPGRMTELPVTMTEDYTLFNVLKDYSSSLWKKEISTILAGHGLMNFIIHPDYIKRRGAALVYTALLEELSRLRSDDGVWVPLPSEVDRWWRERSEMKLVPDGQNWKVEGQGSNRAKLAYARLDGNQLVYEVVEPVRSF
jgi:hypothetical protein